MHIIMTSSLYQFILFCAIAEKSVFVWLLLFLVIHADGGKTDDVMDLGSVCLFVWLQ